MLLAHLFPRLREWSVQEWPAVLGKARQVEFDRLEQIATLAGVIVVAWQVKPATSVGASALISYLVQFVYLAPVLPLVLGPFFVERRSGDLTQLGSRTDTEIEQVLGQHVRFAVAAGQPLRSDMLRVPPAVHQGQTVRIVGVGAGFTIANEGKAMNRAGEGEPVRVRLGNGQVVSGIARHGGVVEVRF